MIRRSMAALAATLALAAGPAVAVESVPPPPVKAEFAPYTAEIAAAQGRLDAFLKAFNARDIPAYEATFNFPHVRFHSGAVTVMTPGYHKPGMFESGSLADWDHSAWQRREVVNAGLDKVHINTRFARYRKDGSLLGAFDSIYIVTKVNGRWGIQGRSSFAP
mgnify:CR=1 FL=1